MALGLGWWVLNVTALDGDNRSDASGYGQFVLAAVGLLIVVGDMVVKALAPAARLDLDELTDQLASAMRAQWEQAAAERGLLQPAPLPVRWRRSVEPVAGPPSAAVATRDGHVPFEPLPGLAGVTAGGLRAGNRKALHRVYGGLPSGRVILLGGPGSGKSSAAVLLLLDALRYREQVVREDRGRVPVPVLTTLSGWDAENRTFEEWFAGKLGEVSLLRGREGMRRATALLRSGRITVFLDGLDEIPAPLRTAVLRSLSEQVTTRLVLLTRTGELLDAAVHQTLVGAVALELLPLRPVDVADHLLRPLVDPPPAAWRAVADIVTADPDHPVTLALSTPLVVSLLHDVYPSTAPVDELLETERFPDARSITDHLLDHVVDVAYTPRPGLPPPRYSVAEARRALVHVAAHLTRAGSRDLRWWLLPTWVPRGSRIVLTATTSAAASQLAFASVEQTAPSTRLVAGVVGALVLGLGAYLIPPDPPRGFRVRFRHLVRPRLGPLDRFFVLAASAACGIAVWQASELLTGLFVAVVLAFGFTAFFGLVNGVLSSSDLRTTGPVGAWRRDITGQLALGAVMGAAVWLLTFSLSGWTSALTFGLLAALLLSSPWNAALAQVYFALRYRTPLRLLRFLDDARSRHLLRTVGPVYQFRHALLQDRLAGANMPTSAPDDEQPPPMRNP
ncbi:hypothetical protein ACIGNX_31670 [Actinosynnema sp. NPDC053489]|uniref:hypothetical protein n=1 Tax=Actinosynnema sp. NPDC053489 TaxID=3363916 RepID=UPI0037C50865